MALRIRCAQVALLAAGLATSACTTKHSLMIESDPPGALVRLDERVLGRTPLEAPFKHCGRRRITLYLPGYMPYSETLYLKQPWYATFPIDLITEILIPLGLQDRHEFSCTLQPDETDAQQEQFGALLRRAQSLRAQHTSAAEAQAESTSKAP
jgi:hypothetical protein